MPYDDPDPQDPMMLVGVALPADRASQVEMACVIAEEFARMGYDERQILQLFKRPFYAGAYAAYRDLGEEAVEAIVRECVGAWGRMRLVDHDAAPRARAPEAEGQCHD
jgi:hypothetical protein